MLTATIMSNRVWAMPAGNTNYSFRSCPPIPTIVAHALEVISKLSVPSILSLMTRIDTIPKCIRNSTLNGFFKKDARTAK
jgi:hypothetical protein